MTQIIGSEQAACECGCCGPAPATMVAERPADTPARSDAAPDCGCGCGGAMTADGCDCGCADDGCECGCGDTTH